MRRQSNPINRLLGGSTCVFEFATAASFLQLSNSLTEIFGHGEDVALEALPHRARYRLTFPHSLSDAFGGLFILGQILPQDEISPVTNTDGSSVEFLGNGLSYRHAYTPT